MIVYHLFTTDFFKQHDGFHCCTIELCYLIATHYCSAHCCIELQRTRNVFLFPLTVENVFSALPQAFLCVFELHFVLPAGVFATLTQCIIDNSVWSKLNANVNIFKLFFLQLDMFMNSELA